MATVYKSPIDLVNDKYKSQLPNDYAFDTTRLTKSKNPAPGWRISDKFDNSRLVRMTADDYYKLVANDINADWQKLQAQRRATPNELSVDEMANLMRKGEKFPTPWIHLNNGLGMLPHFQEGLHRMLAAKDVYGDKAKFPVLLGYEKGTSYDDLEDAIDKGTIDEWIQKMNASRSEWQTQHDNKLYEEEQRRRNEDKLDAAQWFNLSGINGPEDVDDETLERYYKELDKMFDEI